MGIKINRAISMVTTVLLAAVLAIPMGVAGEGGDVLDSTIEDDNIVWDRPSSGESGSMPLGNGATGVNAWIIRI